MVKAYSHWTILLEYIKLDPYEYKIIAFVSMDLFSEWHEASNSERFNISIYCVYGYECIHHWHTSLES